jgi:tetratricopeptide (TPR) repeat protein
MQPPQPSSNAPIMSPPSNRRVWLWIGFGSVFGVLLICGTLASILAFLQKPFNTTMQYAKAATACDERYTAGALDEAMAACSEAIAIAPEYAAPYVTRGYMYFLREAYPQALADFDTALRYEPNNGQAYINRGITYERMGDFDQALETYNTMLDRPITNRTHRAYGYNNRGVAYERKGETALAIADYRRAILEEPALPDVYANLDALVLRERDNQALIVIYTSLVEEYPSIAEIRFHRGTLYRMRGEANLAYDDFLACRTLELSEVLRAKVETQIRELEPLVR